MSLDALLDELESHGISLATKDNKLKIVDPLGNINASIIDKIKRNKNALIDLISAGVSYSQSDFPYSCISGEAL